MNQFFDLPLDNFLVQMSNVVGHGLSSPLRMCVATLFYQRPSSLVYFLLYSICATCCTFSRKNQETRLFPYWRWKPVLMNFVVTPILSLILSNIEAYA